MVGGGRRGNREGGPREKNEGVGRKAVTTRKGKERRRKKEEEELRRGNRKDDVRSEFLSSFEGEDFKRPSLSPRFIPFHPIPYYTIHKSERAR